MSLVAHSQSVEIDLHLLEYNVRLVFEVIFLRLENCYPLFVCLVAGQRLPLDQHVGVVWLRLAEAQELLPLGLLRIQAALRSEDDPFVAAGYRLCAQFDCAPFASA